MANERTVAIIQARLGSTRLPGKVLKSLLNKPMLVWVVERVKQCRFIDEVMIATTDLDRDDAIAELCQREGWLCSRGSEDDVLDRYYKAALDAKADCIVRITSDCPLIDAGVCDRIIAAYRSCAPVPDFVCNTIERTYPRGLDVELMPFSVLQDIWERDENPDWREHVAEFIYHNPEQFKIYSITNPQNYSYHRWTVDTPEDFELIEKIYTHFGRGDFSWQEVLAVFREHPDWVKINEHIEQKTV